MIKNGFQLLEFALKQSNRQCGKKDEKVRRKTSQFKGNRSQAPHLHAIKLAHIVYYSSPACLRTSGVPVIDYTRRRLPKRNGYV
jgi:hypothetical protein